MRLDHLLSKEAKPAGGAGARKATRSASELVFSFEGAIPRGQGLSGDHGGGDPRVPIPNTTVKPSSADGTWTEGSRESRTLPGGPGCPISRWPNRPDAMAYSRELRLMVADSRMRVEMSRIHGSCGLHLENRIANEGHPQADACSRLSWEGRTEDAWAPGADEGRGERRYCPGEP